LLIGLSNKIFIQIFSVNEAKEDVQGVVEARCSDLRLAKKVVQTGKGTGQLGGSRINVENEC